MLGNKTKVTMTEDERTILILALNELRNRLISEDTYTDAVDELILKLACQIYPVSFLTCPVTLGRAISLPKTRRKELWETKR